ncbi:MAG: hypothetical protein IPO27_07780 [Bacteroidetes bacterium]|nr:hypothetical protein [Bacteroidota bacterium]
MKSAPGDSINVEHYQITIDSIINNAVKAIYADTELKLRATTNGVTHIDLSLLKLTIDSITSNGSTLPYTYNDTTIHITLPFTMNSGDSVTIAIYYHGKPFNRCLRLGRVLFYN